MSSRSGKPPMRSAAWRISLWATLAYACGTLAVFVFLHRFVERDIQRRSDAWLSGEVETLGDVAERTPKDALYNRVVGEVAELATREAPVRQRLENNANSAVFFLQTSGDGSQLLWVGAGGGQATLRAILASKIATGRPTDLRVEGFPIPFRVASARIQDGSRIFLGLSERDELRVLRILRLRFFLVWVALVLLGFGIVFLTTKRMLSRVRGISEAASRIGQSDLATRVPTAKRNDEIAQLALTLNHMLDRIENSMRQLHTITGSLAHDLRSPLTAIRGKLEASLSAAAESKREETLVAVIEEVDRLTDFLDKSLDVAEAKADALRLARREIDLDGLLRAMIGLYEPSMSEKGLLLKLRSGGEARVFADEALVHRMIANLLDNELKHLPPAHTVTAELSIEESGVALVLEDNGPGFDPEVLPHLFERRVKGKQSNGHGLGLAFVDAVARAHGGSVAASNRDAGGAHIVVVLPRGAEVRSDLKEFEAVPSGDPGVSSAGKRPEPESERESSR